MLRTAAQQLANDSVKISFDSRVIDRNMFSDGIKSEEIDFSICQEVNDK